MALARGLVNRSRLLLLDGRIAATDASGLRLVVAGLGELQSPAVADAVAGSAGTLALRPEQVHILGPDDDTTAENRFDGRVRDLIYHGDVTIYTVLLANGLPFKALKPNSAPGRAKFFEVGDSVRVAWHKEAGIFLR